MLKKLLYKYSHSDFLKGVLVVMTGTAISQIIALVVTPILTRSYKPDDFGLMLTYMSIFSISCSFVTGKYERVMLLAKSNTGVKYSSSLCFYIACIVSSIALIIIIIGYSFVYYLNLDRYLYQWLLLMPILLLIYAVNLIALTLANFQGDYKRISAARIIKTFTSVLVTLLCIVFLKNVGGLILGEFFGYLISTLYLFPRVNKYITFRRADLPKIYAVARKYKNFPIYNIPSDFLNVAATQMPAFFLTSFFGTGVTGFYSLMKRVLDAPVSLLSSSVLEVFRQKAASQYRNTGDCRDLFVKTARNLIFFSLFPFSVLFFFAPGLFSLVFGDEWRVAGDFARIFSVFYFFKFISSPLSYMFYIAEKQRLDFILHIYIFLSTLVVFCIPKFYVIESSTILWVYCINFVIIYFYYLIYSYILTRKVEK